MWGTAMNLNDEESGMIRMALVWWQEHLITEARKAKRQGNAQGSANTKYYVDQCEALISRFPNEPGEFPPNIDY
jgi:hypothetical protein